MARDGPKGWALTARGLVSCVCVVYSRPKKLDDVAHQDEVVQTLKRTLQSGNVSWEQTQLTAPARPAVQLPVRQRDLNDVS
jgi:hypothetical protein